MGLPSKESSACVPENTRAFRIARRAGLSNRARRDRAERSFPRALWRTFAGGITIVVRPLRGPRARALFAPQARFRRPIEIPLASNER